MKTCVDLGCAMHDNALFDASLEPAKVEVVELQHTDALVIRKQDKNHQRGFLQESMASF